MSSFHEAHHMSWTIKPCIGCSLKMDHDGVTIVVVTMCNRRGSSLESGILCLGMNQDLIPSTIHTYDSVGSGMFLRIMGPMETYEK